MNGLLLYLTRLRQGRCTGRCDALAPWSSTGISLVLSALFAPLRARLKARCGLLCDGGRPHRVVAACLIKLRPDMEHSMLDIILFIIMLG